MRPVRPPVHQAGWDQMWGTTSVDTPIGQATVVNMRAARFATMVTGLCDFVRDEPSLQLRIQHRNGYDAGPGEGRWICGYWKPLGGSDVAWSILGDHFQAGETMFDAVERFYHAVRVNELTGVTDAD